MWKFRARPIAKFFLIFVVVLQIWFIEFALEIYVDDLKLKVMLSNMQFFSIAVFPLLWVVVVLYYINRARVVKPVLIIGSIFPILTNIVVWTNDFHHLFRIHPYIDSSGFFPVLVNDYGFWYYCIDAPYRHMCAAASFVLLMMSIVMHRGIYRKQSVMLLVSFMLPMVFDVMYITKTGPVPEFNLFSVSTALSGVLASFCIRRYRLFDNIPEVESSVSEQL